MLFRSLRLEEQDSFASIVESCWNEFGPSERYVKRLIMKFVRLVEMYGNRIESNELANIVAESSAPIPDPLELESCYLSFCLDHSESDDLLRIRIFPHHNDVSLRLWEAGTYLSEFLIQQKSELIAGKRIIELGSGKSRDPAVFEGQQRAQFALPSGVTDPVEAFTANSSLKCVCVCISLL